MPGQFGYGVGKGWRGDLGYIVSYKAELADRFVTWSFESLGLKGGEKSESAKRLYMCVSTNTPAWSGYRGQLLS